MSEPIEAYLRRALLARVYDVARESPLERAPRLSTRLGCDVWLKREDLQPIFSFKLRGAYNKLANLGEEARARGVVTASAGNHAQGVALSASRLGVRAVVVMPRTTPSIKVEAVRAFGAEVELVGDTLEHAAERARALVEERGLVYVHPYDDADVIAGQATIGVELVRQCPAPLDAVFVPVGGGGLAAGVGAVLKSLRPEIRVIGVEPEGADAMARSFAEGRRVALDTVSRFAEGVAVRTPGEETLRVCREVLDEVVVVSNDAICAAIRDVFECRRALLEPSGALAYAGLKQWIAARPEARGLRVAAIASGANVNFERLGHVSERADLGERREAVLAVSIPERPGSFRAFCLALGAREITECNYRRGDGDEAHVFCGVRVEHAGEVAQLARELEAQGYGVLDLTDDEIAKVHVRHLVGGRARHVADERLYAFLFPERRGALAEFLAAMRHPWSISLFHYRNHGSDFGRVLVGLEVPDAELAELDAFVARVGFEGECVTGDPACGLFLR